MESSKPSDHDHTQKAAIILNEARDAVEWDIPPLLEAFYEEVVERPDSNCWYFDNMFDELERLLVYYNLTEFGVYGDPSEAESESLRQLIREGWESFLEQYNAALEYSVGGPCDDDGEEVTDDEMGDEEEAIIDEVTDDEMGDEEEAIIDEVTDDEMADKATDDGEDATMDMTT
ncbi:hypothetical protein FMEXI_13699 [Fusarium mexicanum]|uniref:Uncharacterized protein n=1 Tax=Fusarium mexicanum TaxID=751941 RepID=A0A8H5I601_9HYPO|nr:hypothetical protein FMEXI_13699 [Fusarium mexicanum]